MSEEDVTNLGGRLGPRLVQLIVQAVAQTQLKMGDHKNGLAQQILADFTNHVSDEVKEVFDRVFIEIANNPETPAQLRPAFEALGYKRGQAFGWIGGSVASTTISTGLFDLIGNWLAPVVHALMAESPNTFLSPDIAAQAVARAFEYESGPRSIEYDAAGAGINPERFQMLVDLARMYPTVPQTWEMVNRGIWSDERGKWNLRQNGVSPEWMDELLELRKMHLSPDILATMFNRDVVSMDEGKRGAGKAGMSPEDFEKMAEIYGEPLGPQALGEAFRRGMIDRDRYLRGIVQGPVRKEWFDVIEALQYSRMSTVDAADAVNQGHMPLEEAQDVAKANGLLPTDFETLIQTAGAPPGIDFITEALNRRLIDTETFNAAFFESRIKNKYVHLFEAMRYRLIPQETVRLLYRNGVYSREATLDTLLMHGFKQEDAEALLALEETRQDEGTRELTRSQIVQLYTVRAIDLATTLEFLLSLGYSDNNARAMIELADLQRLRTFVNSAVTRIKSAYLAGRMDAADASASLDSLGLSPDERDDLFLIWDIDKTTISKTLTAAQIRQAFKKNLISEGDAMTRLTSQGYDATDAGLYLQLTA